MNYSFDVKLEGKNAVRHLGVVNGVSSRGDVGSRIVQLEDGTWCGVCSAGSGSPPSTS